MKLIKNILYAVLMSLIFLSVVIFAEGIVKTQKMQVIIDNAKEEENYHIILRAKYQSTLPLLDETYVYDDFTFDVKIFETAAVIDNELVSFLEFVFIKTEGEITEQSSFEVKLITSNKEQHELWFLSYLNSGLYTVVKDNKNHEIFKVTDLFQTSDEEIKQIKFSYKSSSNNNKVESFNLISISKDDLTLKNKLDNYYNDFGKYPTEDTEDIKLFQSIDIDTSKVAITTALITGALIMLLSYYIYYVKPKRKLGKKKPSSHLQKDLDKLKEIDN